MSTKKMLTVAASLLVALCLTFEASAAPVTLYYPDQRSADFSLVIPGNWEIEQAEEEGGFVSVTGPTGIQLSFRTIEATSDEIDAAIDQSMEWIFANYSNVEMDDPEDAMENGMEGFSMAGTAREKGTNRRVVIVMEWLALNENQLAEVWLIVGQNDEAGLNAGGKIMKTLRRR